MAESPEGLIVYAVEDTDCHVLSVWSTWEKAEEQRKPGQGVVAWEVDALERIRKAARDHA